MTWGIYLWFAIMHVIPDCPTKNLTVVKCRAVFLLFSTKPHSHWASGHWQWHVITWRSALGEVALKSQITTPPWPCLQGGGVEREVLYSLSPFESKVTKMSPLPLESQRIRPFIQEEFWFSSNFFASKDR